MNEEIEQPNDGETNVETNVDETVESSNTETGSADVENEATVTSAENEATVMTEMDIDAMLLSLNQTYSFQDRIEAGSYKILDFSLTLERGDVKKENTISGKTVSVIRLVCQLEGSETDWVKTYSVSTVDTFMKHMNLTSNTSGRYVSIVRDGELMGIDVEKLTGAAAKILVSGSAENRRYRPKPISAGEYWYLRAMSAINAGDYSHFSVKGETVVIGGGTSAHIARGSMGISSEDF